MRLLSVALFLTLVWLQYELWLGKNGVTDYWQIEANVAVQQQANQKLVTRNQQMYAEIADLKRGQEAIEERARNELGMIKPDETFFRLVDKTQ